MIRLDETLPFDGRNTFACGQCFRWTEEADGSFIGIASGKICRVQDGIVHCPPEDDGFWADYFGLDVPYDTIVKELCARDPRLVPCTEFGRGLRLLRQELWETLISFIISANNHIPRIQKIIRVLCETYGETVIFAGKRYHTFPAPEVIARLAPADLQVLHAGYRDAYLLDAAEKVTFGAVDLKALPELPTKEARAVLMKIKGVGPKVADCILLFALGRYEVFPRDVWILRVLKEIYGVERAAAEAFVAKTYGAYGGFAQQYLFHYYRNHR